MMLALSSRSGALAARIGPRLQMSVGPVVVGVGMVLLRLVGPSGDYLTEVLPGVRCSPSASSSPWRRSRPRRWRRHRPSTPRLASAVNNDVARAGGLIAVAVLPALSGLNGRSYLHPVLFAAGFRSAVVIAGVASAAGGVLAAVLGTQHHRAVRRRVRWRATGAAPMVRCPLEADRPSARPTHREAGRSCPSRPPRSSAPTTPSPDRRRHPGSAREPAPRRRARPPKCENVGHERPSTASGPWRTRPPSNGPRSAPARRSARPGWPPRCWACWRALGEVTDGFAVDQLRHSLQTATRAERAGADDDMVVAALCHDIGKYVSVPNHPRIAAEILRPYVRDEVVDVIRTHQDFQGRHYYHHFGGDPDAREQYRGEDVVRPGRALRRRVGPGELRPGLPHRVAGALRAARPHGLLQAAPFLTAPCSARGAETRARAGPGGPGLGPVVDRLQGHAQLLGEGVHLGARHPAPGRTLGGGERVAHHQVDLHGADEPGPLGHGRRRAADPDGHHRRTGAGGQEGRPLVELLDDRARPVGSPPGTG